MGKVLLVRGGVDFWGVYGAGPGVLLPVGRRGRYGEDRAARDRAVL